jgi:hypothetical protein
MSSELMGASIAIELARSVGQFFLDSFLILSPQTLNYQAQLKATIEKMTPLELLHHWKGVIFSLICD